MQLQFYRVQDFTGNPPFLIQSSITLKNLETKIKNKTQHSDFDIFYHWKCLPLDKYSNLSLREIAQDDIQDKPIFYICDRQTQVPCELKKKYADDLHNHFKEVEDKKMNWTGQNGHVLFDDRNLALMASSVHNASCQHPYFTESSKIKKQFTKSMIGTEEFQEQQKEKGQDKPGFFRSLLMKIGLISKAPKAKNLLKTIHSLKKVQKKQDLKDHINREYSDYDPNFATYLEAVYIKFAILSAFKLHYVEYKKGDLDFGIIKKPFPANSKIGIIGDFGTGLKDSIQLLEHLIMVKQVDIILHLGDVYYAGTPHEYDENVLKPLNKFRTQCKRQILFYSIPGNHDYYSWGLPYLCFLKQVNSDLFTRQEASYFCLRSQDNSWQFLGLDTAFHDSNPFDQIDPLILGPHLRTNQVKWAKDKLQNFKGSTILLTHHQLFSIHDRICGSRTKYRRFSCLNPLLSAQLFQYQPYISSWYWGHEHAFMLFRDNILGVPKCRLMGNSSFHVFSGEKPYQRKEGFPMIPFIEDDKSYGKKYRPLSPNKSDSDEPFYNYCYGFIDFGKKVENQNIEISYYCCPCYDTEQKNPKNIFEPYLLHKETIFSKKEIKSNHKVIHEGDKVFLKAQIGLLVSDNGMLDLSGCEIKIGKQKQGQDSSLMNGDSIVFKTQTQIKQLEGVWKIVLLENHESQIISQGSAFFLLNLKSGQYLSCQANIKGPQLIQTQKTSLFMFLTDSFIKL